MLRSLLCLLLLWLPLAHAFEPEEVLPNARQEAQAKILFQQFRCMVCAGESLAESDATLARSMRATIRSQIAECKNPQEITDFMVSRYGTRVTLTPPVQPSTWLLWAGPFFLLFCGFIIIYRIAKR